MKSIYGEQQRNHIYKINELFQCKVLRKNVDAPYYVSNLALHTDLGILNITSTASDCINKFHDRLTINSYILT